jgi:hypothetical protein
MGGTYSTDWENEKYMQFFARISEEMRKFRRRGRREENINKMGLVLIGCEAVNWIELDQNRV